MTHYTQERRKKRIETVKIWVNAKMDYSRIIDLCCERFGCSVGKAIEYISEAE